MNLDMSELNLVLLWSWMKGVEKFWSGSMAPAHPNDLRMMSEMAGNHQHWTFEATQHHQKKIV